MKKYPKSPIVGEVYYLLGQLYLLTDNNDYAISSFKKVPGSSPRAADAMLQVGKLYIVGGDAAHAKQSLDEVIKNHPKSVAAEHAKVWLKTMQ